MVAYILHLNAILLHWFISPNEQFFCDCFSLISGNLDVGHCSAAASCLRSFICQRAAGPGEEVDTRQSEALDSYKVAFKVQSVPFSWVLLYSCKWWWIIITDEFVGCSPFSRCYMSNLVKVGGDFMKLLLSCKSLKLGDILVKYKKRLLQMFYNRYYCC